MLYVNCHHFFPKSLAFSTRSFKARLLGRHFNFFSEGKPNFNFLDKHFSLSQKLFATYSPKFLMTSLVNYHKQGQLEGAQVGRLPGARFSNRGPKVLQNFVKTEKRVKSDNVGQFSLKRAND